MKYIKKSVNSLLGHLGYQMRKISSRYNAPVELSDQEITLIKQILDSGYTMTSFERLANTVRSCNYVVENKIAGDFVECGVWRGGNGILAKKVFSALGSDKMVWMFDTFGGMTEPTEFDVAATTQTSADEKFKDSQRGTHNAWCYASLEDVQQNCLDSGFQLTDFTFIKGDVCKTLGDTSNLPSEISILRLDTDWYESTKSELEILYPLLSTKGVLIIDDYGHWEGARKAVDEYFQDSDYKPYMNSIDYTGRSAIKI